MAGYEAAPFYKKGGLGDVLGSLPTALREQGVDARVIMPFYHQVRKHFPQKKIGAMVIHFGSEDRLVKIYQGVFPETKTPIYFLENQRYINLVNVKVKKLEQFVFFDLAVCYFINWLSQRNIWQAQIVHCNDWHTALIPLILKRKLQSSIPTLLTIHNLLYQGSGSPRILDLLHMKDEETIEIKHGRPITEMNILGEGIRHASMVSTVSPEYAKEITHEHKHNVIYQYLRHREEEMGKNGAVVGILNGIDESIWNPERQVNGYKRYSSVNIHSAKQENKALLLKEYRLPDRPTFCFIGRMANQKGVDLLIRSMEHFIKLDCNVIFLGEGHYLLEAAVKRVVQEYHTQVRAHIGYSEELAHKLHAGSDFLLMPSVYEPCGLVQMVAMRYGTIPVASKTGGLIDTIEDGKTGFLFEPGSTEGLVKAVKRSLEVYKEPKLFHQMRERCMRQDFSWDKSAKEYKKLYEELITPSAKG